jgi:uncharacterized alpha/beta hydrolase family protein
MEYGKMHKATLIIVVLLIIGVLAGSCVTYILLSNTECKGLTATDKNYLSQLIYVGGFCERQGFASSFRTAYNTDLNRYEGFPICVERV